MNWVMPGGKATILFWVGDELVDNVGVAGNRKVEAPVLVDAGLPEVLRFVVLLGVKRGVFEIVFEEANLLEEGFSHCLGRFIKRLAGSSGVTDFHRPAERLVLA